MSRVTLRIFPRYLLKHQVVINNLMLSNLMVQCGTMRYNGSGLLTISEKRIDERRELIKVYIFVKLLKKIPLNIFFLFYT